MKMEQGGKAEVAKGGNVSTGAGVPGPKRETVLVEVAPSAVRASGTNPRRVFSAEGMAELTRSVGSHGVLQPLIVRRLPKWELKVPDLVEKGWRIFRDGKVVDWVKGDGSVAGTMNAEKAARRRFEELKGTTSPQPLSPSGEGKGKGPEVEYELVAGERRWRAAKGAGLKAIPVLVTDLTDGEVIEVQYLENLQREDLSPLEEAEGFARLTEPGPDGKRRYTVDELAVKLGKDRTTIFNRLKLMRLSKVVRMALEAGEVESVMAMLLTRIPDPAKQEKCLKEALTGNQWDGPFSVRDLKEHIERNYQKDLKGAPWDVKKVFGPLNSAYACEGCPKRSGNMVEEFPEFKGSRNLCTDLGCWERKLKMWTNERLSEARANGQKVLEPEEYEKKRHSFQDLASKDYSRNNSPTYRRLIGADGAKKATVAIDEEGELHELMTQGELAAALKEAGVKKPAGSSNDYEKKQRAEQLEKRTRREVMAAVRAEVMPKIAAAGLKEPKEALWRCLVGVGIESLGYEEVSVACELCRITKENADEKDLHRYAAAVKGEKELRSLALQFFALGDWMNFYQAEFGERFRTVAEWAGMDVKKMVKEGLAAAEKAKGEKLTTKNAKGQRGRKGSENE